MPTERKCAPCLQAERRNPSSWLDGYFSNFLGFGASVQRREALKMVVGSVALIAFLYAVLIAAAMIARWFA